MTREEFIALLSGFTLSAESGDGARFAGHFTEDGIYYDYIYGPHTGRADIASLTAAWATPGRCRALPPPSRSSEAGAW
jgi:hypothetical protein